MTGEAAARIDSFAPNEKLSNPAWQRRRASLRVDDGILRTVVFVGQTTPAQFIARGTAFVTGSYVDGHYFQVLVTARHVIDRISGDTVSVRVNRKNGEPDIVATPKAVWFNHPNLSVDVAVCPINLDEGQYDILHIDISDEQTVNEKTIEEYKVGIGDEVYIAGLFTNRLGDTKNIPILRIGTIAAMPEEEIRTEYGFHHAFLIEARSIDGLSGSPVHFHQPPVRMDKGSISFAKGREQLMMGMLLGHNQVQNPDDIIRLDVPKISREAGKEIEVQVPLNTGIGIVLPISYIIETMSQPRLDSARKDAIKRRFTSFVADTGLTLGS